MSMASIIGNCGLKTAVESVVPVFLELDSILIRLSFDGKTVALGRNKAPLDRRSTLDETSVLFVGVAGGVIDGSG